MSEKTKDRIFHTVYISALVALIAFAMYAMSLATYAGTLPLLQAGPGAPSSAITLNFSNSEGGSAGCSTPCTSGSFSIGAAAGNRYVHVASWGSAAAQSLLSLTICGQTGTINKSQANTAANGTINISTANVPLGTTCTVVTTWALSPSIIATAVWYSYGLSSAVAVAGSTGGTNNCTTCSAAVTGTAGGFVLSAAGQITTLASPTWTNVTQDFYINGSHGITGASKSALAGGSISPQVATMNATFDTYAAVALP